ncbi:MAG: hypothetical protein J5838_04450 [Desulfovibrio sp.]|nr:hypothetical protein [Desulfovibrio sp.]
MLTEAMIQTVVREVLKRLQPSHGNGCVLVLGKRDPAVEDRVRSLLASSSGAAPDIVFSGECCSGHAPDRVILPKLSCSAMADLAAGRASEPCSAEVLGRLLCGEKVEVLEMEYRTYASTAPAALYKLYASYENTLKSYGLVLFQPKRQESVSTRARLITAADVEKAAGEGANCIDAPSGAIITPLAAEKAEALGISLRRQG